MNNTELMKIRNAANNIFEESTGLNLLQFGLFYDIIEELSFFDVLHNKKEVSWSFDYLLLNGVTS